MKKKRGRRNSGILFIDELKLCQLTNSSLVFIKDCVLSMINNKEKLTSFYIAWTINWTNAGIRFYIENEISKSPPKRTLIDVILQVYNNSSVSFVNSFWTVCTSLTKVFAASEIAAFVPTFESNFRCIRCWLCRLSTSRCQVTEN